jgi:site-specific DNA-methyltransferase (adenine-specific)
VIDLRFGDCLVEMRGIADASIDLVLADLPYGVTACRWDQIIPFEPLWAHYKRLLKPRGAVVLTASQPFTTDLIQSNRKWFKYCLVWDKVLNANPLNSPYQPLRTHEDIVVFSPAACTYSPRGTMVYNPQMATGEPYSRPAVGRPDRIFRSPIKSLGKENTSGLRYPTSVIRISNAGRNKQHKTAKPDDLMEYIIRTYSNEGDTVLDNAMGSGTTLEACLNTNRHGIGIEKDPVHFATAQRRLASHTPTLFEMA